MLKGRLNRICVRLDGNHRMTNKRETPLFLLVVAARSPAYVARLGLTAGASLCVTRRQCVTRLVSGQ